MSYNICCDCDQDPIQCYEKGYCIYDHDEEVEFYDTQRENSDI